MMPNVVRGRRMAGLMNYLVGPGRSNEHSDPHLVAGDDAMMQWHGGALTKESAYAIARHLDRPHKALGVDVAGGHVWHASLSLRADEGKLPDQDWGEIARDFVKLMGFDDPDSPRTPCRWVAVRHGVSKNGNDHIHIVVDLVREDGTKASTHHDFKRAQTASRALEVKYGLEPLESVRAERATRGYDPAEREAQAAARARGKYERTRLKIQDGRPEWKQLTGEDRRVRIAAELRTDQPRYLLGLKVRGCAAAASSEAEFVRRMRGAGLIVRPRLAEGEAEGVTGYSVAERPQAGERPIWYGGGHLARDLTLPRLREQWQSSGTSDPAAMAEWNAARKGRRVVSPGIETQDVDPELWERRNNELGELVERLRTVDVNDRDTWATVARQTAGALAAWSNATEQTPGDLAAAADALSHSAQTYRRTVTPVRAGTTAISGAAMLLATATRGGQGTLAQAVMIRSILRLTQAVYDAAKASGQARHAQLLASDTRARLTRIRKALPAPAVQVQASSPPALDPEAQAMLDRVRMSFAHDATKAVATRPTHATADRRPPTRPDPQRGPEREGGGR